MAKELIYRVKIVYDAGSAAKGASVIDRTQERAQESVNETTAAIRRQQEAQENTVSSTRNYSRAQSNANQTLFTFGDLLNDSQQFQFGFAQGARAIGNNIGFAAEQISNTTQRTGSFRGTIKALGSSLLGPGGMIIGINLVVTALTVFGDKLFESEKAAEDLNEELEQSIKNLENIGAALAEVRGISDGTIGQIQELRVQQERLNQRLEVNKNIIDELTLSQEDLARLQELRNLRDADGIDLTAEQTRELKRLARQQEQNADVVEGYRKENEQLQERLEELNQEEQALIRESREVAQVQTNASEAVNVFALRAEDADKSWNKLIDTLVRADRAVKQIELTVEAPDQVGAPDISPATGSIADLQMRLQAFQDFRKNIDPSTKAFDQMTSAIQRTENALQDLKTQGTETGEELGEALVRAGAQAIIAAENTADAADRIIDTVIAEIVAYAIRSAVRDLPFPTNLIAAAGAAAAGRGLAELIPDFGGGGGASGGGGTATAGGETPRANIGAGGGGGGGGARRPITGVDTQSRQEKMQVQVINTFDEQTAAFAIRKGEAKIRADQQ